MPMSIKDYPPDWPAISARVRQRNGGRCEWCNATNGQAHPVTGSRVVLTVAHLDHDKGTDESRMRSLCQSCHNRYDSPMRQQHASETRRRKREQTGQRVLAL